MTTWTTAVGSTMTDFDMPTTGTWEQRGGWVVRALMRDLGLTLDQAAGFIGNAGYESAGFTKLQEIRPAVSGSKGGRGWPMWTGYIPPNDRRAKFEAWCVAHGLHPDSDEANYGYILEELRGDYRGFLTKLRLAIDIEDACRLTHREYEVPSDVLDRSYRSFPDRLHWAQRALAGAQSLPGGTTTPPTPAPGPVRHPEPPAADVDEATHDAGVQNIQLGLRLTGDYDGAIDGIWGKASKAALAAFQQRMESN